MKKTTLLILLILISANLFCSRRSIGVLKTDSEKMGYAFGVSQGKRMANGFKFDVEATVDSFQDALEKKEFSLKKEEYDKLRNEIRGFFQKMQENPNETLDSKKATEYGALIGFDIGKSIINLLEGLIDTKATARGFEDALAGKNFLIPEAEIQQQTQMLMAKMQTPHTPEKKKLFEEGKKFLEENKKKKDVVTTPSGLQYRILTAGAGRKPTLQDKVKVHYRGKLINGEEFDSSYSRNQPAEFGLQGVIMGWTEVLQLMPVGSKWQVFIPQELGYGNQGSGKIPPFSVLIFEIELLGITK